MSKRNTSSTISIFCVLMAGALWGCMGYFSRKMGAFGIGSDGLVILRCGITSFLYAIWIALNNKKEFHVELRHWWCFLGIGILSMLFFSYSYFLAMSYAGLSVAAVLLYTAPAFVCILSAIFFGERLGQNKVIALILSFIGCALVSGIGSSFHVSSLGLRYGLCAGFGYALYSIFARAALNRKYTSLTISFYACLLSAIGGIIVFHPVGLMGLVFASKESILWTIATAVVTCFLPYALYTYGLTGLETGRAALIASIEPVIATLFGVIVFHERVSFEAMAGIVLVLIAIFLINRRGK